MFQDILSGRDQLFDAVDKFSATGIPDNLTLTVDQQDPFTVSGLSSGWLVSLAMIMGILAPFLIGGAVVILLAYLVFRKRRSR